MPRPSSPPPVYELHTQNHDPPASPSEGSESSEPQRVHELWFEDGNIVIRAGNSLYRVYRGALANRSSVFQDMLSFPQPPTSELVEGCPFVELPDSELEVTPFLRAIFEPEFFMPFPAATEFDAVVGCLRLSHKYQVDYLRRRALVHFSSGYPTRLSKFDLINRYLPEHEPSELEKQSWSIPEDSISRMRAILIAREVDAPWILPRAFYTLAVNFDKLGMAVFNGAVYKGVETRLSEQDQTSFLKGYDIQRKATVDALGFLSHPLDIQGCRHTSQCDLERLKGIEFSRQYLRDYPASALYIWEWSDWDFLRHVCPSCTTVLKKTYQDAREAFWNRLPEIYDVAPWDVLEQLKTTALG
ncbi:hypothetical protein MVEN_01077800 [Mycena venus]|uniref:BTB domain-containing protein n=1 Tax=Mycena venus TaxID=2733690 RepID=A0A8H6Y8P4_9AGAR|nr:hypothetical protein MVEN_01077800 [Mycena venus]